MPSKAEFYRQMAEQVSTRLVGSWQKWTAFLTTAARLYKYPFHEQMMIYAQRPDATACAEYDLWNEKMGRYVRRGSKGIALVDDSGDKPRLRYVFDISETGTREHSRTPWLWQLEEQHIGPVSAMLECNYLPSLANNPGRGFPEESAWLTEQLKSPEFRQTLAEEYAAFWTAYQQDRDLLRFHYHKPKEIWGNLKDLSLPRTAFTSQMTEVPTVKQFITEDEIDAAMTRGSGVSGGKGRIFAYFQNSHTDKEKVDFLRHEYGIGGHSHALSGAGGSWEDHDGKGLHYKKGGCPDVHFTWEKVAKRITNLIQKGRYLTEQEQEEFDKIQAEKALAEEDALQAQPPDTEPADVLREDVPEQPIPTLRELHERYKPIVLEAVTQDIRYRNACGHSDYENAMIECNAAVRRAILDSHDIELIRLFSDVPEFRQRLHREVADETYPKLHELLRPLSDNDIDRAIQDWNGKIESKHAVVRYMKDHAREKDTAAWLAREFDGGDGKTPFAVRPESPEGTALPWPKVQRRIAQLIKEDRFYTQVEQDNLDDVDPIAIRETLAQRGIVDGHVVDPEKLDNDPFVQQVMRDVEAISRETAQADQPEQPSSGNSRVPVSDKEYAAARGTVRERTSYDPTVPPYHVGDIVYLDDRAHQITELRDDTVELLPTGMSYPIYRAERQEQFEQLLRADNRNDFYTEFLPANPDAVDQDLRDVLAHGLIGEADKAELSQLLHNGKSNREVALWLSRAYPNIVETMELETGDTADYDKAAGRSHPRGSISVRRSLWLYF